MPAPAVRDAELGRFALVMATGIVSAGLGQAGFPGVSDVLLLICAAAFLVLVVASCARAWLFPAGLRADVTVLDRAFASFCVVAACAVLGNGLADAGQPLAARVLAGATLAAWLVLSGMIPVRLAVRGRLRPGIAEVNGTWYLWTVATQSLAITAVFPRGAGLLPAPLAATAALALWLSGVGLYVLTSVLIAARLMLRGLGPPGLRAPYWVAMGAAAISDLAAAHVLRLPGGTAVPRPAASDVALALWALASVLVPALTAVTVAHYAGRLRPRYDPSAWTIIFPAGMYATASMQLGEAAGLPLLRHIGAAMVWPAAAAWALTFTAMTASLSARFCRVCRRRLRGMSQNVVPRGFRVLAPGE